MTASPHPRALASAFESPTFGEDSSFHVEQPVGSMSISPCGRDVVLASKEGLHVIDLDSPYSPPRYLPHHTPWEVADVQWSPFAARDSWVVSTSNQKALVWNLAMKSSEDSIEHVLHAHSRAITDINFSAHNPEVLATCAVDSFVHCWDLRTPAKPVVSFSDWFAGATQVKWNRQDPHVIASSHDKFLQIWDDRKGAYPMRTIEAHDTKIYGLDWNRIRPGGIVTCSLDKTIKFWDYSIQEDVPEKVIETPFPVWRARHTPFGWGVLAMPQRGNSDLHLYSRRIDKDEEGTDTLPLVHSFPGHKGQVKEFLWRPRGTIVDGVDYREFQLVSWGTDKELRLHRVDPDVTTGVGFETGKSFIPTLNVTRKGAVYKTFRDEPTHQDFSDMFGQIDGSSPAPQFPGPRRRWLGSGIGMSNVNMPYAHNWSQRGNIGARVGMQGKSNIRSDMNPIMWMRGVKISGWDVETLGDEITHVGEKFTKVVFESVDVRQRKATISMRGPWGPDGTTLFLKVDINFPADYPQAAVPQFNIQKTAAVTDELAGNLGAELRTISETYLSRKSGCLEGILRYLLGERSLEESVAWALGEAGEPVKSPNEALEGEDSSDEDEEVGKFQGQDLGMSSSGLLRPSNANVMVPVAKHCGALWAHDGRLVCFFPPKKEKSASFLNTMGLSDVPRLSRNDKIFEGFGRLQTNSPGPKTTPGAGTGTGTGTGLVTATDDGVSDYSDDSSVSSSSSSGSSDLLASLPARFQPPQTWRNDNLGFQHSRSNDNSQKSTTGFKTTSDATPNIISIHNFEHLLPTKRSLAKQYRIFGDRADVCAHNATVAEKSGDHDLSQVWGLVQLILYNQVPLDAGTDADIVTIARRALRDIKRKDSGVDLTYDGFHAKKPAEPAEANTIRWGCHPFGGTWLIPALFDHFEQLADIQTLAMLSCIFHEPDLKKEESTEEPLPAERSLIELDNPAFSLDYYPSMAATQSISQHTTPPVSNAKAIPHATPVTQSSGRSSTELWHSTSTSPFSTGTTPPMGTKTQRSSMEQRSRPQSISLSGTPEQNSGSRSNLGTALASSLTRSFTLGPSLSSSPPSNMSRKKQSPAESLNTTTGPGGWTSGGFLGKAATAIPDYLTASTAVTPQTHSEAGSEKQKLPKAPVKVRMKLKNQEMFDNDGYGHVPFLDRKKAWLYRAYRGAYAHLLLVWDLPVQRSEVLKIDYGSDDYSVVRNSSPKQHEPRSSVLTLSRTRRKEFASQTADQLSRQGLDVQRHCARCGFALTISVFSSAKKESGNGGASVNAGAVECPRCKPKDKDPLSAGISCVVCREAVDGMFVPCLECGHVTCFECHQEWFLLQADTASMDQNGDVEYCPSGCGCNCLDHMVFKVPVSPPVASLGKPINHKGKTLARDKARRRSETPRFANTPPPDQLQSGHNEEDLELWRGSPFTTLSKGLGGGLSRGLRRESGTMKQRSPSTGSGRRMMLERMDTM
ncbi:hypothetical protein FQN54_002323 [Arachnomyces sp. PD_36]|nr:hypothetical protein FQN54_002323 [Arachnomyces sp. PD_36]